MTVRRVTVYVLVAVLFAFAASVTVNIFEISMSLLKIDQHDEVDLPYKTIQIDWTKLYPFENESIQYPTISPKKASFWESFPGLITTFKERIAAYTQERLLFRLKFIETASIIENFLGASYIALNEDEDYLYASVARIDVTECAESLVNFNDFLRNRNIPLLYVQAPDKVSKDDAVAFTRNLSNRNADDLLSALKGAGVFTLDLREEIHRQRLVHHDLFFKTDHHWKPETGLWAAKIIAERLNASFGFDIDTSLYDPELYNYQVQDGFLGSIGRRASLGATRPEPFTFIFPKFKTDLTLSIPSRNINERDDFIVIYYKELREYMSKGKNIYEKDYYSVYLYGLNPVTFMRNNHVASEKKILVISDSFNLVVSPFLALSVKNTDILNLNGFTGSVRSFIDKTSPDIVLVLYSPGGISYTIDHDFDFR
jgi:hypothetical protein